MPDRVIPVVSAETAEFETEFAEATEADISVTEEPAMDVIARKVRSPNGVREIRDWIKLEK